MVWLFDCFTATFLTLMALNTILYVMGKIERKNYLTILAVFILLVIFSNIVSHVYSKVEIEQLSFNQKTLNNVSVLINKNGNIDLERNLKIIEFKKMKSEMDKLNRGDRINIKYAEKDGVYYLLDVELIEQYKREPDKFFKD